MENIDKVRKIRIVDLVRNSRTSIRLKNCINVANKENQLPIETIGDYLDAGITAKNKLLNIKHFGRKTADELISIIETVCSKELPEKPHHIDQIRDTLIVDLAHKYEMSNRLRNRIIVTESSNKFPFPFGTVGDYLDAGVTAEDTLLELNNLGRKTAEEFICLIEALIKELPKLQQPLKSTDVEIKHISDDEARIRNISIVDLVNQYAISPRLKNCINVANEKGQLPIETIGDYLDAGVMARDRFLAIDTLGRKSVGELSHLIETIRRTSESDKPKNKKRLDLAQIISEQYPGVFDPLIEKYFSTPEEDKLGLEKLEVVLRDLCDKKSKHAEMAWFRFSGETLKNIGELYGLTRERVRQITAKYTRYMTNTDSKLWAEKAVRHLIKENNSGNILPDETQLKKYHPKLLQSLILNFSTPGKGPLNSVRLREIAKSLNLDIDPELGSRWSLEKCLFEVRQFAQDLGCPELMPMQKDMREYDRQDLRYPIAKYGGQSRVAKLAGLTYQGQMVSPDGSRTYWTDDRIKTFLHEVARKEGHPGFMPTPSEAAKYAPNPTTMFSIFTRQAYLKKANISWFELAQIHGLQYKKGLTRVTQGFIKSFVKSLGGALYHLSPAEIYVLFEQQGMTKTGVNRHRDRISDNLVEAIQSGNLPKGEIERWLDDEKGELIDALLNPEIKTVEEAFQYAGRNLKKKRKTKHDNPEDDPYREDIETRLPVPSTGDTLDSLKTSTDLLTQASSDKEAVEFLIAKAADKLWKRCFYDENTAVKEANNHKGNAYSESARDAFIEEYTHCTRLPIPKGYSFVDPGGRKRQPKLMQRLIAYRVFTKGRVLNLSGTGTGKTLSAILASRVIGAKLTIITCPNVTVDAWRDNILNAFPWSEVIIKPKNWELGWKKSQRPRYIVVNHETFQNRNESALKRFIIRNPYDLVVIDEIHQAKQRDPESETQRRRLLNGLITDIPQGRAKPRVLGLSATPIINNLQEGKSLIELVTSLGHDDIGTKANVPNCMRLYQRFTTIGFRMMPKSDVSREPQIHPVDATPLLSELVALGTRPHPQKVEAVLVKARWSIIKNCLRKKTVIFTEYVKDIVPVLSELVESSGFSVGIYTGDEKLATSSDYQNALDQFIKGDTDVLIASIRTIATGVDGLQYACNNVIFASLPWTSANYDQAVGRFDREGFAFDRLDIHIPKTYAILSTGEEWSWCDSRLRRLENKRDIAKAAIDGEIPDTESQLTPAKATQYWMGWLKRLNDEGFYEIERREIKVPLDESDETESDRRYKTYGDFSKLNARWNNTNSSKTQKRLAEHPEEWCFYHTRLLEQEKTWQVVPRDQCVKHLQENLPRGSVVADFGCGQGKLVEELKGFHIVHSFDHLAIHPGIVSGDMSHTPLDDGSIDAAVFSLSLMGTNIGDYISEAYRILKLGGQLIIWHPAKHNDRSQFIEGLKENGFAIVEEGQIYKWHRIWAIKQARKTDDVTGTKLDFENQTNAI